MKLSHAHLKFARRESKRAAAFPLSRAFTLIEIALCLAIIGFALLAVMIVLPYGMNTQRDNREETVIGQDASVLLEVLRNGSRGADDLTNYVFAITNYWTRYNADGTIFSASHNGYTFKQASEGGTSYDFLRLTNGANIIGQMSQPELTDTNFVQIPNLMFGGISNHVVAYVRSISGLAAEKPSQSNPIMVENSFSYRIYCVNGTVMLDTNLFKPLWVNQAYVTGAFVFHNFNYWRAAVNALPVDEPGFSPVPPPHANPWIKVPFYPFEAATRQRDLRLTFLWPLLPNGGTGHGRQTFRATPAGDLKMDANHFSLFFYEPQNFSPAP